MKNIWLLIKTNLKRNRLALLLSAVLGIVICMMIVPFGSLYDGAIKACNIGVIDHDNSKLSIHLKEYLVGKMSYQLVEGESFEQLSKRLIEKEISAIIEIPKEFSKDASSGSVKDIVFTSLDDFANAAYLEAYINNYMRSIQMLVTSAGGNEDTFHKMFQEYQLKNTSVTQTGAIEYDKESYTQQQGFVASLAFFIMLIYGIGMFTVLTVQDDMINGVYSRVQITPMKPWQYLIGSAIFGMLLNLIIIAIFCGYIVVNQIDTGISMYMILLLLLLFSTFTVCFDMFAAMSIKTKNASTIAVVGFATLGAILGGAYFPLDLAPQSLQNLSRITPHFWFMDSFRQLQKDAGTNILPHIIILILFIVLTFLIGAVIFSQNYKKSRQET